MNEEKAHIKVVILGNVDSGKTTLAGHLIYKCGLINKQIFNRFEKNFSEVCFFFLIHS
jgi:elongation factor 1-alpha